MQRRRIDDAYQGSAKGFRRFLATFNRTRLGTIAIVIGIANLVLLIPVMLHFAAAGPATDTACVFGKIVVKTATFTEDGSEYIVAGPGGVLVTANKYGDWSMRVLMRIPGWTRVHVKDNANRNLGKVDFQVLEAHEDGTIECQKDGGPCVWQRTTR